MGKVRQVGKSGQGRGCRERVAAGNGHNGHLHAVELPAAPCGYAHMGAEQLNDPGHRQVERRGWVVSCWKAPPVTVITAVITAVTMAVMTVAAMSRYRRRMIS